MELKNEAEAALETATIAINGMTCDNCVRRVERALRGAPGVKDARVDRAAAQATVTFESRQVDVPRLRDILIKIGYQPGP